MAFSTVYAVEMGCHENSWPALWANLAQALHLARVIHLVQLQHTQLHLLVHVLLLLWSGISLLLTLLSSSQKTQRHIQLRIVSHSTGRQLSLVLELATSEENALVGGVHALASGDSSLHISHAGIRSKLQHLGTVCKSGNTENVRRILVGWKQECRRSRKV